MVLVPDPSAYEHYIATPRPPSAPVADLPAALAVIVDMQNYIDACLLRIRDDRQSHQEAIRNLSDSHNATEEATRIASDTLRRRMAVAESALAASQHRVTEITEERDRLEEARRLLFASSAKIQVELDEARMLHTASSERSTALAKQLQESEEKRRSDAVSLADAKRRRDLLREELEITADNLATSRREATAAQRSTTSAEILAANEKLRAAEAEIDRVNELLSTAQFAEHAAQGEANRKSIEANAMASALHESEFRLNEVRSELARAVETAERARRSARRASRSPPSRGASHSPPPTADLTTVRRARSPSAPRTPHDAAMEQRLVRLEDAVNRHPPPSPAPSPAPAPSPSPAPAPAPVAAVRPALSTVDEEDVRSTSRRPPSPTPSVADSVIDAASLASSSSVAPVSAAHASSLSWVEWLGKPLEEQLRLFPTSPNRDVVKSVLLSRVDPTGDLWRQKSLCIPRVIRTWALQRNSQSGRTDSHRSASDDIKAAASFRFPAELRDNSVNIQAETWKSVRPVLVSMFRDALKHGVDVEDLLTKLSLAAKHVKYGNKRIRGYLDNVVRDQELMDAYPPMAYEVLLFRIDTSYQTAAYGNDTLASAWDACVRREASEDPVSLANRVLLAYLQKIDSNEIDGSNVWEFRSHANNINNRYAQCLVNDETNPERGRANKKTFVALWRALEAQLDLHEVPANYISCVRIAQIKIKPDEDAEASVEDISRNRPRSRHAGAVRVDPAPAPAPPPPPSAPPPLPPPSPPSSSAPHVAAVEPPPPRNGSGKGRGAGGAYNNNNNNNNNNSNNRGGRASGHHAVPPPPPPPRSAPAPPPPAAPAAPAAHPHQENNGRRYCSPPANGAGKPSGTAAGDWTPQEWSQCSIDFVYMDTLVPTAAGAATAKARPLDGTMTDTRLGTQQSLDGVNWAKDACAYCFYRTPAPAEIPPGHERHWFYGTGNGAHNPYRCQCAKRYLAEGGEIPQYSAHLRACLRYDPRPPQQRSPRPTSA